MERSLPDGWPLAFGGRKVRSPQGGVPANGRGDSHQCEFYGKCHRKYTAGGNAGKGEKVR